jgi:hypothetical protein
MGENGDFYSILHEVRERSARKKCEKEMRERNARKKCEKEMREARRIKILYPANFFFMQRFSLVTSSKVEQ